MKWPIVGESGASNGGHQRVQMASENIVIILIYGYSIIYGSTANSDRALIRLSISKMDLIWG